MVELIVTAVPETIPPVETLNVGVAAVGVVEIVYAAEPTALFVSPVATAMAWIVSAALTVTLVPLVLAVVGVVPSVV